MMIASSRPASFSFASMMIAVAILVIVMGLMAAACTPAATPAAQAHVRPSTTVRTSCPDVAPSLDDDPNHMVLVEDRTIERVCVLGASSEESRAAIARACGLREGEKLDQPHVRKALDALVELKTIEDASIGAELRGEGVVVYVDVRERPRIDEVIFHGASALGEPRLGEKGPLEKGAPLDRRLVTAVVRAMEAEYTSHGYGSVKIESTIEPASPGHVNVRFVVHEGPIWTLSKLVFSGRAVVPEADLLKATMLTTGTPYEADKVERASLLLSALYYDRGMVQVRIGEPKLDVAKDGAVTIVWSIDEGDVYRVGTLRFGKLAEKMQKELLKETKTRPSDVFDRSKLTADIVHLKALFESRGKKVEITPITEIDPKKKKIDLVLNVEDAK